MSLKGLVQPYFASILTSDWLLRTLRSRAESKRRRAGQPHRVTWYHRVDDPYSHLLAQCLGGFLERHPVELSCKTVDPPPEATNPHPELLASHSRRDALELAPYLGLSMPQGEPHPDAAAAANSRLLALESEPQSYLQQALELGQSYWSGQAISCPSVDPQWPQKLQHNRSQLERRGHYSSGMLEYGGEWYWGPDRLAALEQRLEALGVGEGRSQGPLQPQPFTLRERRLECYLSVRSPYSYLALERVARICETHEIQLQLKPVLPMVMRGLPVPRSKRLYIVFDAKREALRHGIPFGRICDPLGAGVERTLAVYFHLALEQGKGVEFLQRAMQGAWSQGIELASDRGLRAVVEQTGLAWTDAQHALDQPQWRTQVESHRRDLFDLGLWGVPSFALGDRELITWGQDRIWLLEEKCKR